MLNKIYVAIFVILFAVVIGEIGYLFYSSKQSTLKNNAVPTIKKSITATSQPERQGIQAIKDNVLARLSVANSGVLKSSTLTNHYEGKVIELSNKIDDPVANYGIKIRFQGENGEINGFFLNKNETSQILSVFRYVKDAPLEKITINDLKVGDSISIDEDLNLLNDDLTNSTMGFKITIMP